MIVQYRLAAAAIVLLSCRAAWAVNSTWKVNAPSADWYDAANWSAGVPQAASDGAFFAINGPAVQTSMGQPTTLGALGFSGRGTVGISGPGPLTFSEPSPRAQPFISVTAQNGPLTATIDVPIVLTPSKVLSINHSGESRLSLNGQISGDGALRIAGRPTPYSITQIRGNNVYTGLTTIDVGNSHSIDAFTSTAFGDASSGTLIRSGHVSLIEGTAEEFTVERDGYLYPSSSNVPYSGKITLAGGTLNPHHRFATSEEPLVTIASEVAIVGRGYIGRSPSATDNAILTGRIAGDGVLILQGGSSEQLQLAGDVAVRGDVWAADRSNVLVTGQFAPRGDLLVDGGISSARIRLEGDLSQFDGNIETRLGYLSVANDLRSDHVRVDARLANWRESLQRGGIVVEQGATLDVGALEFFAGGIEGRLTGVDAIEKRTSIAGSVRRLEGFDGAINVHAGWLDVLDSQGLGTTAGATTIASRAGAAIALETGVRIEDAIYLNNSSGIDYSGSLIGGGEMAGDLYLGNVGSYVGGAEDETQSLTRSGNLTISGAIHGGSLSKMGLHTELRLTGDGHDYIGDTRVLEGKLILAEAAQLATTASVVVDSQSSNYSSDHRAMLIFDDRGGLRSNDRLDDSVPVHLKAGRMTLLGSSSGGSREVIGALHIDGGYNRVTASSGVFQINQLQRARGAVVAFGSDGGGAIELNAPLQNGLIGGWATIGEGTSNLYPAAFATIVNGKVAAAPMTQKLLSAAASHENIQLVGANSLSANVTVNALRTSGDASIDLNGRQLKVESGGFIVRGMTSIDDGTVTAGGEHELFFHLGHDLQIGAAIVDDGASPVSVHFSQQGPAVLSGANSYSGGTTVSQFARLTIASPAAIPANDSVDVDGGQYLLEFGDRTPVKLRKLTVRSGGYVAGDGSVAIDADSYEVYAGQIGKQLAGAGVFVKRGEGFAQLSVPSPSFRGPVLVEQGTLDIAGFGLGGDAPSEASAVTVREGGMIQLRGFNSQRQLILEGGTLFATGQGNESLGSPIVVRGHGVIRGGNLTLQSPISGSGNLTIHGPYDNSLEVMNGFSQLDGDVTLTGGQVTLAGNNTGYQGTVFVRASGALTMNVNAFGSKGAVVEPEGILNLGASIQSPLRLNGGKLVAVSNSVNLTGPLVASADSVIDVPENWNSGSPVDRTMHVLGTTVIESGVRVKKTSPGRLALRGPVHVGAGAEIVAWEGKVDLSGAITATSLGSTLNLVGNGNIEMTSVNVPAGTSLQILNDGLPAEIAFDAGSKFAGNGALIGDVDLGAGAVVAPGASAGTLSVDGNVTIGPRAIYQWELANSLGVAGQPSGWDLLSVGSTLAFEATSAAKWTLSIDPLFASPAVETLPAGLQSKQWLIASANSLVGFDPTAVTIDRTALVAARPQYGAGKFSVAAQGNNLMLVYQIPEPTSAALGAFAVTLLFALQRTEPRGSSSRSWRRR